MKKAHFVHIPKNGGMTIRRSPHLKNLITTSTPNTHINPQYTKDLLTTMNKYNEHHGYEHARWRDLKPSVRNGRCFAIVRNPWSKVVSRYTFLMHIFQPENQSYKKIIKNPNYKKCSFEEFLEERHEWGGKKFFWHRAVKGWFPQKDHVTDENGNLRCDILRLEHFDEDVMKYFELKQPLHVRNVSNGERTHNKTQVSNKRDYKEFYTNETKEIVADWYKQDIEFFGFTFKGTATKNIWNME